MDNKATTKRMIGAVVLVLVAALLLAWLLKGKNRDGQQDMAMNQASETKPILGFPGIGEEQKPSIVAEDPNAAAQQQGAGIDVGQQQGTAAQDGSLIPGIDVKLPETAQNTTGFAVRPGTGGEVRDLVDTDGKVKDGTGSMGTGDAKASAGQTTAAAGQDAGGAVQTQQPGQAVSDQAPAAKTPGSDASASQQDKPATSSAPAEKKASSKVVLVNERPVPRAQSEDGAKAAAAKAAAAKKAAEDKAAALAKTAADKAAAAKSMELAKAKAAAAKGSAGASAGGGSFIIQVMASGDKAKADATAAPLRADGYNVGVSAAKVGGKTVYRVNVSGYGDRAAAEAAQAKMKSRYKQNQAIQGSFVTSSK